jgi:hypothetical protein
MSLTKTISSLTLFASLLSLTAGGRVLAQEPARHDANFDQLNELKASYERKRLDLDRREIIDLAALAAKTDGAQADAAYRELFSLAIARELITEAREPADRYLASTSGISQQRYVKFRRAGLSVSGLALGPPRFSIVRLRVRARREVRCFFRRSYRKTIPPCPACKDRHGAVSLSSERLRGVNV